MLYTPKDDSVPGSRGKFTASTVPRGLRRKFMIETRQKAPAWSAAVGQEKDLPTCAEDGVEYMYETARGSAVKDGHCTSSVARVASVSYFACHASRNTRPLHLRLLTCVLRSSRFIPGCVGIQRVQRSYRTRVGTLPAESTQNCVVRGCGSGTWYKSSHLGYHQARGHAGWRNPT